MRRDTPGAMAWAKKPRARMKPRSKKGAEQAAVWAAEKAAHLAGEPTCQHKARGVPLEECWGPLDVHHIEPRGAGGRRGEAGPKVTLCRAAHDWVETHRAIAKTLGLLLRRA